MDKFIENSLQSAKEETNFLKYIKKLNLIGLKINDNYLEIDSAYDNSYQTIVFTVDRESYETKKLLIAIKTVQYLEIPHDKIFIYFNDTIHYIKSDITLVIDRNIPKDVAITSSKSEIKFNFNKNIKIGHFLNLFEDLKKDILKNYNEDIPKNHYELMMLYYQNETKFNELKTSCFESEIEITNLEYKNENTKGEIIIRTGPHVSTKNINTILNKLEPINLEIKDGFYVKNLETKLSKILNTYLNFKPYDNNIRNFKNLPNNQTFIISDNIKNIIKLFDKLQF
ncbi:MAG: hypothetical protein CMF62_00690 [Magnetococcales bacterium]|nr:hypothetical protein [Magnetococcales bacterium]|tara:strand:- start:29764 stop:30612 length:849 start_codon:yes stop_codon:yes gene_type:complete